MNETFIGERQMTAPLSDPYRWKPADGGPSSKKPPPSPFRPGADTQLTSFRITSRFKSSLRALVLWPALRPLPRRAVGASSEARL